MSAFRVTGIDWATEPKNRALASIESDATGNLTVTDVVSPLGNEAAVTACRNSGTDVVAVDIPFGWPQQFQTFVGTWTPHCSAQPPSSEDFRYRNTDLVVKNEALKAPLSVSSNLIAIGTREWIEVCCGHGLERQIDVIGQRGASEAPNIIEVYPGGTLTSFAAQFHGLQIDGYKSDSSVRLQLLTSLCQWFSLELDSHLKINEIVGKGKDSASNGLRHGRQEKRARCHGLRAGALGRSR